MSHKTHQKNKWQRTRHGYVAKPAEVEDPRFKSYERRIEAVDLILNHISAPPEHKIKMVYELEKLKQV